MKDVVVLALVLLLIASGYAAGRVHAEIGYRAGYRLGYRQGIADAVRHRPGATRDPQPTVRVTGLAEDAASDSRHFDGVTTAPAHKVRHTRV